MEDDPTRSAGVGEKNPADSLPTRRATTTTEHAGGGGKKHEIRIRAPATRVKRRQGPRPRRAQVFCIVARAENI